MANFTIPDFIENSSVSNIHKRMRDNLPNTLDVSEGSHPWNLTYPNAYEYAYFIQYCLLNAIKMIWPEWSSGVYSDYHGNCRNMSRHEAQYATGQIVVTGASGTAIPEGSIFSTEQIGETSIVRFETTSSVVIGNDKSVTIPIAAVEIGKQGNVLANTITINSDKILGISSVNNPEATSGGFDEESDDDFNARIMEYDKTQDNAYIGNDNDYRRWAMSVDGVGEAIILDPEDNPDVDDDSGIVTIILIDSNSNPATAAICASVYNYIMSPTPLSTDGKRTEGEKTSIERLAPPGVTLVVIPPNTDAITVSGLVELDGTSDIDTVKAAYVIALQSYLLQAIQDGEIRYSKITACLSGIDGVADYKNVLLNNGTVNIQLNAQQVPTISLSNISLTVGSVDG
jgi:uncharacterized phage protein gp47/JayE